jgi:hypothetical protein
MDRIIECEQGSPQWHAARCGRVTGSRIADVVRKGKGGEPSKMRATYIGDLVAERLSGVQDGNGFISGPMQWGKDCEDKARAVYGFMFDVAPKKVGFIVHPKFDMAGCSPDSLVGDDGGLETKCPNSATHLSTLMGAKIDPDYVKQMQWNLACTGRQWWDYVSFDPRFPPEMQLHRTRVYRDDLVIKELEDAVEILLREVASTVEELSKKYLNKEAA